MHVKSKKHASHLRGASSEATPRVLLAPSSKASLQFALLGGVSNGRNVVAARDQGNTEWEEENTHSRYCF